VTPATWQTEVGGVQSEAGSGQECKTLPEKNSRRGGGPAQV
jgi:hypothetical protein